MMRRWTTAALLFGVGCQGILGIEDGEPRAQPGDNEDCSNGVDDDGDGDVDCADADCDGDVDCADANCDTYPCVTVPAGWQGPLRVRISEEPVGCDAGEAASTPLGGETPTWAAAECAPCACQPHSQCTISLTVHANQTCNSTIGSANNGQDCFAINASTNEAVAVAPTSTTGTGVCSASGGGLAQSPPPVTFERIFQGCAQGCDPSGCLVQPPSPWIGPCILHEGSTTCTVEPFTEYIGLERLSADNRDCQPCTCPSGDVPCSEGDLLPFTDDSCASLAATVPSATVCSGLSPAQVLASGRVEIHCPPSGGQPSGAVVFDSVTLCCMP